MFYQMHYNSVRFIQAQPNMYGSSGWSRIGIQVTFLIKILEPPGST